MSSSLMPVNQLLSNAERIGVIGSPSTTSELTLDIIGTAVNRKLVGELGIIQFQQDNLPHFALGQITEIEMRNVLHEDPTMRSLIRQRGRLDAVSERQDTHLGKMTVSAVFSVNDGHYQPSRLGTVPATGTEIYLVEDRILNTILNRFDDQIFYLGHVYGSKPKLPLWFKHFDSGRNGAGEAYHIGVFGKTGSGKSVLTKMMLVAYARHETMGLFVLDPQGEFAQTLADVKTPKRMSDVFCKPLLEGNTKKVKVFDLSNILLDRWELFVELLRESQFFADLGIKSSQYQDSAADFVEQFLKANHKLRELDIQTLDATLNHLLSVIATIYANPANARASIQKALAEIQDEKNRVRRIWLTTSQFFTDGKSNKKKTKAEAIVSQAIQGRESSRTIVVIDLSRKPADVDQSTWNNDLKPLIIDRFTQAIMHAAEKAYESRSNLNTLVVIDEAHRLVPAGKTDNPRINAVKTRIVDAVRTTRKYGLGWMVVSQTLSSLDPEIVQQLRVMFFGFGLSMGSEYEKLRQLVAGQRESLSLYQRFLDPQSAFDASSKEYSFMTIGPVSPLSFASTPLFLNAYNTYEEFAEDNRLVMQKGLFND